MLRLRFINVGDGDAILVEELSNHRAFRMLVDTGREELPRCADFLDRARISRLDRVVITHLHGDHCGGLASVAARCSVAELLSGYIPLKPGAQTLPDPRADKSVRGMAACLDRFSADVARLKADGCRLTELYASWHGVRLTDSLTADFIVPDVRALRLQREVWNHMLEPAPVPESKKSQASKLRNPNSLRVRLHYAGREIELAGDCLGEVWQKEAQPCDIFKIPHHGDDKSVTGALLSRLRPSHAVISCDRSPTGPKDRPSAKTIESLRKAGAQVWFTDGSASGQPWRCADFAILDDGTIIEPGK